MCKKNHVTTDYIMMNNNCVMNDSDNVCPYKVSSILAKSAKFIFQHTSIVYSNLVCEEFYGDNSNYGYYAIMIPYVDKTLQPGSPLLSHIVLV